MNQLRSTLDAMWWILLIGITGGTVAFMHGGSSLPVAFAQSLAANVVGVVWVAAREWHQEKKRKQRRKRKEQGGEIIDITEIELSVGGEMVIEEIDKDELIKGQGIYR